MSGLTTQQVSLLNYIEQCFLLEGVLPTRDACVDRLGISPGFYDACYDNEEFKRNLAIRGIEVSRGVLTPQQVAAVNTLFDFNDTRSDSKKLKELGISSQTYAAWKKDPAFQAYIRQRGESLLPDNMDEAHRALLDSVRRGDISALKLYYEMTGRWSSKTVGELNVEFLLIRIIEAVQKHVSDPGTVKAIAGEILSLAGSGTEQPVGVQLPKPVIELAPVEEVDNEYTFTL